MRVILIGFSTHLITFTRIITEIPINLHLPLLLGGRQFQLYIMFSEVFRKELQLFGNCSTIFLGEQIHKPKESHLWDGGNHRPNDVAWCRILPDSARSWRSFNEQGDLIRVSEKSIQKNTATFNPNQDQAPFYPKRLFLAEAVGIDVPNSANKKLPKKRLKVPFSGGRISEILAKKRWHWTLHRRSKLKVKVGYFFHRWSDWPHWKWWVFCEVIKSYEKFINSAIPAIPLM